VIGISEDCVLSEWSNFGGCSAACGGGTQERTHSITTPFAKIGAGCGDLSVSQFCITDGCPGK